MKHNNLNLEQNVSPDDARAGYKTVTNGEDVKKACNKFLESRGIKLTSFFQKNKKCPTKP